MTCLMSKYFVALPPFDEPPRKLNAIAIGFQGLGQVGSCERIDRVWLDSLELEQGFGYDTETSQTGAGGRTVR